VFEVIGVGTRTGTVNPLEFFQLLIAGGIVQAA